MQVNADLKSASFVPSPEERRKIQSQTLAALFETYFRVLKHTVDPGVSRYVRYNLSFLFTCNIECFCMLKNKGSALLTIPTLGRMGSLLNVII